MIQESTIERILARLESGKDDYETEIKDFAEAQPFLMDYLTNDDVEAFTEPELELIVFAALVIYQSVDAERTQLPIVDSEAIAVAEELNYEVMNGTKGDFRDRLTPFFDTTDQEDLLAFVEDMVLSEAEDEGVTKEAREPFFVTLKTVIDVLTGS